MKDKVFVVHNGTLYKVCRYETAQMLEIITDFYNGRPWPDCVKRCKLEDVAKTLKVREDKHETN